MTERSALVIAEKTAAALFDAVKRDGLIKPGISEKQLNSEVYKLAQNEFGIKKYWHKRIVRAGENTLHPYDENPPDLVLQPDDIVFLDFGPILDDYEADYGRTYVLGKDPAKVKLAADVELAWHDANKYFKSQPNLSGSELYGYCLSLAQKYGWEFGGAIAGHLVGHFPHEKLEKEVKTNYIHPDNHLALNLPDQSGKPRNWIIEIHFVDRKEMIGGFFEQLAG